MDKEELRKRIDLVELIESSGVALHKAGSEWTGRCPFHDDSRASLSVSPDKHLWKCFGCARGGDCFSWVMEREKVDFRSAVFYLQAHGGTEKVYDIEDSDGKIVAQHVRRDYAGGGKGFIWRRDGMPMWAQTYNSGRGYYREETRSRSGEVCPAEGDSMPCHIPDGQMGKIAEAIELGPKWLEGVLAIISLQDQVQKIREERGKVQES